MGRRQWEEIDGDEEVGRSQWGGGSGKKSMGMRKWEEVNGEEAVGRNRWG